MLGALVYLVAFGVIGYSLWFLSQPPPIASGYGGGPPYHCPGPYVVLDNKGSWRSTADMGDGYYLELCHLVDKWDGNMTQKVLWILSIYYRDSNRPLDYRSRPGGDGTRRLVGGQRESLLAWLQSGIDAMNRSKYRHMAKRDRATRTTPIQYGEALLAKEMIRDLDRGYPVVSAESKARS